MSLDKNFRTSVSKQEILDSLSTMHIEESPVIIWQNIGGVRNVKKARIASIDLLTSSLILKPLGETGPAGFDQLNSNLTLYFIGESKNIVFKQVKALKLVDHNKVRVDIPDVVKLQEKRLEQRLVFDNQFAKLTGEIFTGGRTDKSVSPTIVDIRDVSLSGMGFYLPKKSARFFYEKDKIKIERIGTYRFPRPVYGIIVYISEEKRNVTHLKAGIRFVEKLSEESLAKINPF